MKVLLFITVLFSGLVSGLLYGYTCSVNPGLKALSDIEYIKAMQSINHAIQNPIFFVSFIGLLILFPITGYMLYQQKDYAFNLFLSAAIVYVVGVFGVTILFNVPLNDQLAKFPILTAAPHDISQMRQQFEKPWNTYHFIRTLASVIAFSLLILAVLKPKLKV